ncbi:GH25 family lysozyme [Streptomyces sp. NBC_00445]|uniref:glycoside hydrolase family 25 protein n=1 Tax=Streptomyces sp. NBC_00445 TaxID=2975745 RepID=UPI002E1F4F6A
MTPAVRGQRPRTASFWEKLAAAQQFVLIRASEGTKKQDELLRANMKGAKSAGMIRSAYHFFTLDADGAAQAEHFLTTVRAVGYTGTGPSELPPVLDLEEGVQTCKPQAGGKVLEEVLEFLETVQDTTGEPPILYYRDSFRPRCLSNSTALARYPRWLPHFSNTPPKTDDWLFWQHSDTQPTRGASASVSSNVFHDDYAALRRRAHLN